jgi:hypothetical protein
MWHSLHPNCRTVNICKNSAKAAQNFLRVPESSGNIVVRPFITLKALKGPKISFCDNCESLVTVDLEARAVEVWRLLPWAFGLGSWEELIKEAQNKEVEEESNEATDSPGNYPQVPYITPVDQLLMSDGPPT